MVWPPIGRDWRGLFICAWFEGSHQLPIWWSPIQFLQGQDKFIQKRLIGNSVWTGFQECISRDSPSRSSWQALQPEIELMFSWQLVAGAYISSSTAPIRMIQLPTDRAWSNAYIGTLGREPTPLPASSFLKCSFTPDSPSARLVSVDLLSF